MKSVKQATYAAYDVVKQAKPVNGVKRLTKAPIKMEMPEQSLACGMVAYSNPHIPPAKHNKKSKL